METAQYFSYPPRDTSRRMMMVIVDEDVDEDIGYPSSPSSSESSAASSPLSSHGRSSPRGFCGGASSFDLTDDATSSSSTSVSSLDSHTGCTSSVGSPLDQMSGLIEDLPVKRGLSRHFSGKSQSFTSLANARCLQDLVKPVRKLPVSKNIRSCRSYAAGLDAGANHGPHSPKGTIAKRPLIRNSTTGGGAGTAGMFHHAPRPPMHPHSSGNLLFA